MLKQPATPIAVPYSTEAEQCLLGALMLDNDRWDDINLLLKTQDFFLAAHRHVFKAMSGLASESLPIDLITLSEKLEHEGKLDHC